MRKSRTYSSEALVEMIQGESAEKSRAISFIFQHNKAKTLSFLMKKGASGDTADDILQEAMLILVRQIEHRRFEGRNNASVHSYFIGICKQLLRTEQRKRQAVVSLSDSSDWGEDSSVSLELEQEEEQLFLHRCLQQLGDTCRQILLLRSENPPVPWRELAVEFGYKDAQNAMNKGGKCMKQLRQLFFKFKS